MTYSYSHKCNAALEFNKTNLLRNGGGLTFGIVINKIIILILLGIISSAASVKPIKRYEKF